VIEDAFFNAHKDILCPYDELLFSDVLIEARVISKPQSSSLVYFSRIYKRQRLDELGRDGIVSTIVAMPLSLLSQGLAFKDVERALLNFEKANPKVPLGDVQRLKVSWEANRQDPDTANMQTMVSEASANRLVSILSEGSEARAFVLYKAGYKDRNELCIALAKFLIIAGNQPFLVTSNSPMETFLSYYGNVVISDFLPKLKVNSGWKIVNLGNASMDGVGAAKNLASALRGVYGKANNEGS
jgi:hypothetical protein